MKLYCPDLLPGGFLPTKCMGREVPGGQGVSPALLWSDVPADVRSFVLTIDDITVSASEQSLWFVSNIPSTYREIPTSASIDTGLMPEGALVLLNSRSQLRYGGPIVRPGEDPHTIRFRLWALSIARMVSGPYTPMDTRIEEITRHLVDGASLVALAAQTI